MTSIILAGGKSSRLGQSKALQSILGKSLIQWVIDRLAVLSTEIIIVTAQGENIPCSSPVRIRTIADIHRHKGPLAGIHSGLTASSVPRAIVVGCDTPFLSVDLLRHMTQVSSECDVVVPRIVDKVEPLCAVYSRNCLPAIESLLQQQELRITRLFDIISTRYIEEHEIDVFDPQHLSFFNTNSRSDLEAARRLAVERRLI
jgi:molybdenum cofactor guanylyltransferase